MAKLVKNSKVDPNGFKSHSQCNQDLLAFTFMPLKGGRFIDIGACHPTDRSNSYALEKYCGWKGVMIDRSDAHAAEFARLRVNPFCVADAITMNWDEIIKAVGNSVDYLSLDVDECTLAVLKNIPLEKIAFGVITIEHDSYRFGPEPRAAMLEILKANGYEILCPDISDQGLPFEIWAVHPQLVDMKKAKKLKRDGPIEGKDFFNL